MGRFEFEVDQLFYASLLWFKGHDDWGLLVSELFPWN